MPLSIAFAVANHPWVKGAGRAAVRIAMTVARRGSREGTLGTVRAERDLDTDAPVVVVDEREGTITAKLMLGADTTKAVELLANEGLAHMGVKLHGAGFILNDGTRLAGAPIKPFVNGRDLAQRSRNARAIDLFGLTSDEVREQHPDIHQHVLDYVKPERDQNRRSIYRDRWWIWGEPRPEWRSAIGQLGRFIATTRTAKHRLFQFLPVSVTIESKVVGVAFDSGAALAVLSSRLHCTFAEQTGGWLGVGNDPTYNHSDCFNPFPFPAILTDPEPDDAARASLDRLRELGERLEAHRRERLEALPDLTMTGLYNMLERRREAFAGGEVLGDEERAAQNRARVPILAELHDTIDAAVLAAYGWDDLADGLIGRPGGTVPSAHKGEAQEAAEDAALGRLVELNRERAAEEARGHVRWLRPAYQVPKLGNKVPAATDGQAGLDVAVAIAPDGLAWPNAPRDQFGAVRELLDGTDEPLPPEAVARAFKGRASAKRTKRVDEVLTIMADLGTIRTGEREGQTLYFTRR